MSDEARIAAQVEALLDGAPAQGLPADDEVLRHRRLALLLQAEARSRDPRPTVAMIAALIAERPAALRASTVSRLRPRLRPRRRLPDGPLWGRATIVAALIAIGIGAWLLARPPGDPGRITILACRGAPELAPGSAIAAGGTLHLAAGASATLRLADGSRIDATGPLELSREVEPSAASLSLQSGTLRVAAEPQPPGSPLRIRTPHAAISVVGTVFTLSAAASGTRLAVESGAVAFTPHGGAGRTVTAGGEAQAWPEAKLSADFEDGRVPAAPPLWHGKLVVGPPRPGNRFCLEAVLYSEQHQSFGVMVGDWDLSRPGLFAFRPGTRLRCRLWIAPGPGEGSLVVGCQGPGGYDADVMYSLRDTPRGVWTDHDVDLGALPPWHPNAPSGWRLPEGEWIRDLRFEADSTPGQIIYLDDLSIVPPPPG